MRVLTVGVSRWVRVLTRIPMRVLTFFGICRSGRVLTVGVSRWVRVLTKMSRRAIARPRRLGHPHLAYPYLLSVMYPSISFLGASPSAAFLHLHPSHTPPPAQHSNFCSMLQRLARSPQEPHERPRQHTPSHGLPAV